MLRRDFLKRAMLAGAVLPIASSGLFARPLSSLFLPGVPAAQDRVFVLINLNGGNDGLNTVIPINDQHYYDARPSIAIKKSDALPISGGLGLNGVMTDIQSLYNNGQCAIIESVGYPDQDRSHFRSTDIWNTASDSNVVLHTGWMGRYLENSHPEYPGILPTAPFAMQIGSSATLALQGEKGGMGMAIDNPDRFYNLANGLSVQPEPLPATQAGPELQFVRDVIAQSNRYSSEIHNAMVGGSTNAQYDGDNLASQLKVVARLINGGLKTSIYVVTLGGFDTHYGQMTAQAQLLSRLSKGIKNFLADLNVAGNGDRVVCMTYSEFGRRVNENGSQGTDHGAASPQFVFGKSVLGGKVLGGAPNLVDLDNRGDIMFVNDFRQIYSAVLQDWFGFGKSNVDTVLGGSFAKLPLFTPLAGGVMDEDHARNAGYALQQNFPNPVSGSTLISFNVPEACQVDLNVIASDGRLVRNMISRRVDAGDHQIQFDASRLASGTYSYTLESRGYRLTKRMVVVR
ncbi:MAG: DUF1501 domain-containing protein [Candidatus Kapaibacterium sp.]